MPGCFSWLRRLICIRRQNRASSLVVTSDEPPKAKPMSRKQYLDMFCMDILSVDKPFEEELSNDEGTRSSVLSPLVVTPEEPPKAEPTSREQYLDRCCKKHLSEEESSEDELSDDEGTRSSVLSPLVVTPEEPSKAEPMSWEQYLCVSCKENLSVEESSEEDLSDDERARSSVLSSLVVTPKKQPKAEPMYWGQYLFTSCKEHLSVEESSEEELSDDEGARSSVLSPLVIIPEESPKAEPMSREQYLCATCKEHLSVESSEEEFSDDNELESPGQSFPRAAPCFMTPSTLRKRVKLLRCGLPNIGNTCYQNACLQMLRTATPFMSTLSSQERVWKHCEAAGLLRHMYAITEAPYTTGPVDTHERLHSIKQAVAIFSPEFEGSQQQDAHEFLVALIEQIQRLNNILQVSLEVPYICPVGEHMVFHMENTRTCRSCGQSSSRGEVFTVLSLDVLPGSSVENLLQHYLEEKELEFMCDCGGNLSSQATSFSTLPNVLLLHLKRFKYDHKNRLKKDKCCVWLDRSIVLKTEQDSRCFNLSNIISHLGSADLGHYISDGVDLEDSSLEDRWLTYNDDFVSRSTGKDFCRKRKKTAYILMYQRQRV